TFLMGAWLIQENKGLGLRHGVDVLGAAIITGALMLGVYTIVTANEFGWASAHTLGIGGVSLAMIAAFLILESRLANPIMPLRILRIRSLTGASAARALLATGMFTNFFMGVLYLQHVRGFSAFATGLAAMGTISAEEARSLVGQGDPIPVALTGGFQLAFVLAALCVSAGLAVVLAVLRPASGGRPDRRVPEHTNRERAYAEPEAA